MGLWALTTSAVALKYANLSCRREMDYELACRWEWAPLAQALKREGRMMLRLLFVAVMAWLPSHALAFEVIKEPDWWDVVTGIIAIPAGVIGLIYSIVLIKKTQVEVKKTELEIKEKEAALGKIAPDDSRIAQALISPVFEAKHIQLLLLRFVLLYVTLGLWRLAENAYSLVLGGAFLGAQKLGSMKLDFDNLWVMLPLLVVSNLPKLGELAITLGIGLPLFRDVSAALGVNLRSILFFWRHR